MNRVQMLNIDPRLLDKFMRSPDFLAESTSQTRSVANYRLMSRYWTPETRIVYDAIQEGYNSMDQLPVATGLTTKQIRESVDYLVSKDVISPLPEVKS